MLRLRRYIRSNGTTTSIDCGSDTTLDNLPNSFFTVDGWVNWHSLGENDEGRVIGKDNWYLGLTSGAGGGWYARVECATTDAYVVSGSADMGDPDAWHHICICWDFEGDTGIDPQTIYMAIDGEWGYLDRMPGAGVYDGDAALNLIMANRAAGDRSFDGGLSWIRISDSIRFNPSTDFTPPPFLNPPGVDSDTVELWYLNEGWGTVANACVDNDNDGTISGGFWDFLAIEDRSLFGLREDLARSLDRYHFGYATGGSTTTIIDTNGLAHFTEDDSLIGALAFINGQPRRIVDYEASTKTITLEYAIYGMFGAGLGYELYLAPLTIEEWESCIQEAIRDAWPELWEPRVYDWAAEGTTYYALPSDAEGVAQVEITPKTAPDAATTTEITLTGATNYALPVGAERVLKVEVAPVAAPAPVDVSEVALTGAGAYEAPTDAEDVLKVELVTTTAIDPVTVQQIALSGASSYALDTIAEKVLRVELAPIDPSWMPPVSVEEWALTGASSYAFTHLEAETVLKVELVPTGTLINRPHQTIPPNLWSLEGTPGVDPTLYLVRSPPASSDIKLRATYQCFQPGEIPPEEWVLEGTPGVDPQLYLLRPIPTDDQWKLRVTYQPIQAGEVPPEEWVAYGTPGADVGVYLLRRIPSIATMKLRLTYRPMQGHEIPPEKWLMEGTPGVDPTLYLLTPLATSTNYKLRVTYQTHQGELLPPSAWTVHGTPGVDLRIYLQHPPADRDDVTIRALYKKRYAELAPTWETTLDDSYLQAAAKANWYAMMADASKGQADRGAFLQLMNHWQQVAAEKKLRLAYQLARPVLEETKKETEK